MQDGGYGLAAACVKKIEGVVCAESNFNLSQLLNMPV